MQENDWKILDSYIALQLVDTIICCVDCIYRERQWDDKTYCTLFSKIVSKECLDFEKP